MEVKQRHAERLAIARRGRTKFSESITIRLTRADRERLRQLSRQTKRSESDLLRRTIPLLEVALKAASPFDFKAWASKQRRFRG